MTRKNLDSRCQAQTRSGKPCRAAATAGGLCFFHANPNKAAELGRRGGRSNRHAAAETPDPLPTLDNALAVRDTVARLIADVYAGKLHPRIVTGLAPLLSLQLRAIQITNLEERIAKLERSRSELPTSDPAGEGRVKQEAPELLRPRLAWEDDPNEHEAP